ncbi:MAG: phosphomevalonate kinase [Terrimesophilobacter sp.]
MTARPTVTCRAPGKLFITGEYAVMEPGNPAVLVAVDRMVSVTASPAEVPGVVIASDLCAGPVLLRWDGLRLTGDTPAAETAARGRLAHAVAAVEVVAELLAQRGVRPPTLHLAIGSDLHQNGTKLGLGSSGAVTVAVIAATTAHCDLELTADARFRLAMIASARLDVRSSGADLAASTWRGWIAYQAPDRAAVLELVQRRGIEDALNAPWPGLGVRRLAAPDELTLAVGWTGSPAVTGELITGRGKKTWRGGAAHKAFVTGMTECVQATIDAIDQGDCRSVLRQITSARELLAGLDNAVGLGIFTDKLTALCDAADAAGWAGKPSGAGGGDCGIALLDDAGGPDIEGLHARWAAVQVQPLPIQVLGDETDAQ